MLEQGINGQLYQDCLNHFTLTTPVSPVIIYSDLEEQKTADSERKQG
jgi:hypothetical protein